MATFGATPLATPDAKDIEVAEPPTDSVSSMAFSPVADYLAVSSWDNHVRIYEVAQNGQMQGKAMYSHQAPVLSVCWTKDGSKILSGGCDNAAFIFDAATGQSQQVAQHDAPIKSVKWIDDANGVFVTGSWDKSLRYWDLRTPNPVLSVALPERCYTMDFTFPHLVVGTADRHIQIYDMKAPQAAYRTLTSPLRTQTRIIRSFKDGFNIGGVDGRLAVQYVETSKTSDCYSFKCHRKETKSITQDNVELWALNDVSIHPIHGTVSTCGSDGGIFFWDIFSRSRLKTFEPLPGPISATAFNRTGALFAYSVSYDWHKGHMGAVPGHPNKLMVHLCTDDEVKRRPAKR